ncbi:MAG: hypothetical protein PHO06_02850 [Clostridia bacterium]|jgi:hypothetical protein|nr:hypothetical protein [Clostridia bacterium]
MSFGEALINVLAVLAVIIAGGFLIFFVGNFLLSYLESKPEKEGKSKKIKQSKKIVKEKQKEFNDELTSKNISLDEKKVKNSKKDLEGTVTEFVVDEPKPAEANLPEKNDFNVPDWMQRDKIYGNKNFNEAEFDKMFNENKHSSDFDFLSNDDKFGESDLDNQTYKDLDNIFNDNEEFNFGDDFDTNFGKEPNENINRIEPVPAMFATATPKNKTFTVEPESTTDSYEQFRNETGLFSEDDNFIRQKDEIAAAKTGNSYAVAEKNTDENLTDFNFNTLSSLENQISEPEIISPQKTEFISPQIKETPTTNFVSPQTTDFVSSQTETITTTEHASSQIKETLTTDFVSSQKTESKIATTPKAEILSAQEQNSATESYEKTYPFISSYDASQVAPDKNIANASQYFKTETFRESELKEEIELLKQELLAQKIEYERLKSESELSTLKFQAELTELGALYAQAERQIEEEKKEEKSGPVLTIEEYQSRLEILKARLKINEKELRANKKEFLPLQRVRKTLDKDKKKLRRREALVAKQKVVLYGVNNIADIDEEKAKKLSQDLDLLDGLKISVQHCEEVIEANKERYPILETTYRILTSVSRDLKDDISECEENIKIIKGEVDVDSNDSVNVKKSSDTDGNGSDDKGNRQKPRGDGNDDNNSGGRAKKITPKKDEKSDNKIEIQSTKEQDKKEDDSNGIVNEAKALISEDTDVLINTDLFEKIECEKIYENVSISSSNFASEENLSFVEFENKKANSSTAN